jgi:hypothetical protein
MTLEQLKPRGLRHLDATFRWGDIIDKVGSGVLVVSVLDKRRGLGLRRGRLPKVLIAFNTSRWLNPAIALGLAEARSTDRAYAGARIPSATRSTTSEGLGGSSRHAERHRGRARPASRAAAGADPFPLPSSPPPRCPATRWRSA